MGNVAGPVRLFCPAASARGRAIILPAYAAKTECAVIAKSLLQPAPASLKRDDGHSGLNVLLLPRHPLNKHLRQRSNGAVAGQPLFIHMHHQRTAAPAALTQR